MGYLSTLATPPNGQQKSLSDGAPTIRTMTSSSADYYFLPIGYFWSTTSRRLFLILLLVAAVAVVVVGSGTTAGYLWSHHTYRVSSSSSMDALGKSETSSNFTIEKNGSNHKDDDEDGSSFKTNPKNPFQNDKDPSSYSSICQIPVVHGSTTSSVLGDSSALQLWIRHLETIHAASRLEDDHDYLRHDFTAQLLALVTPRLDYAMKSWTKDWHLIDRLLNKAWVRYQYLVQQQQRRRRQQHEQTTERGDKKEKDDDDDEDTTTKTNVPPPIQITVMGGSVTMGIQCHTGIPGHEYHDSTTKYCAWPHRLESMVNRFFGVGTLLQVTNEAVGATNTAVGRTILQYNVISGLLQHSDILIHAYSTNDAGHAASPTFFYTLQDFCRLVLQPLPYRRTNGTLQDALLCQSENVPRNHSSHTSTSTDKEDAGSMAKPWHHQRPLLIHIDDVLTPLYIPLRNYSPLPERVSTLANYYGFVSLSYADMVRDYVLADPKESWFSTNEFPHGVYHFDIHPGQGMHIAMAWMVAYAILQLTTTFCTWSNEFWTNSHLLEKEEGSKERVNKVQEQNGHEESSGQEENAAEDSSRFYAYSLVAQYEETVLSQSMPLVRNGTMVDQHRTEGIKPQLPPPLGLLPALDAKMTPSDLNRLWRNEEKQLRLAQQRLGSHRSSDRGTSEICPFTWLSAHDKSKNMTWVQKHVVSRLIEPTTWQLETHYTFRKTGLTPPIDGIGATMNFHYVPDFNDHHHSPLRTVVIFYLKSYGPNWENSRALFELFASSAPPPLSSSNGDLMTNESSVDWRLMTQTELIGHHGRRTSEMYVHELFFDARRDSGNESSDKIADPAVMDVITLRLQVTLVGGRTFKVMGLAFCH
jgi:hypothetical protein